MNLKWLRQSLIYSVLILIALTLSIRWTYISIKSKTKAQSVREVSMNIIPEYQIRTKKDLKVWPAGTVYDQGMAAYFYAANPEVIVTPKIEVVGMEQGTLNGMIQSQTVIQAINDKSQVYWSYEISQTPIEVFTLFQAISGEANQTMFASKDIVLDVPAAYELISKIGEELMFQRGEFQLIVTSDITINGSANGIIIEKTVSQVLPLELQDISFIIPKTKDVISSISFNQSSNSSTGHNSFIDLVRSNPLPISLNIILAILLVILILNENKDKSKDAIEHRRFKEWITEGSVEIKDGFLIHIFSLEGLVDLAIDLDKRVIYDSKIRKYYVLTEDIVYIYDSECPNKKMDHKMQLGKLLLERGILKPEQLEIGIHYEKKIGSRLGESLMALGFIDETTLYSTLAAQQKMDYYELDSTKTIKDTSWVDKMSINKARALMTLPLGQRIDGKLVIACSETSKEGVKNALLEMFGSEIYLVTARPSAIYEILEQMAVQDKHIAGRKVVTSENKLEPFERLSEAEQKQFIDFYFRGDVIHGLLLKASGLIDSTILSQALEQESVISWLRSKNFISDEFANLMRSLDNITKTMDWKTRHEKKQPLLMDLLVNANYITLETVEWVNREIVLQGLPLEQLLINNYIVSVETIKNATTLLNTIRSILYKSPNT